MYGMHTLHTSVSAAFKLPGVTGRRLTGKVRRSEWSVAFPLAKAQLGRAGSAEHWGILRLASSGLLSGVAERSDGFGLCGVAGRC